MAVLSMGGGKKWDGKEFSPNTRFYYDEFLTIEEEIELNKDYTEKHKKSLMRERTSTKKRIVEVKKQLQRLEKRLENKTKTIDDYTKELVK